MVTATMMSDEVVHATSGLYDFVVRAEPVVEAKNASEEAATDELKSDAQSLLDRLATARVDAEKRVRKTLDETSVSLRAFVDELESKAPTREQMHEHWQALGVHYSALADQIRDARGGGSILGRVKPRNYARNFFHMLTGLFGIWLYEFALGRTGTLIVGGTLLVSFIFLEITRRHFQSWNDRLYHGVFARIGRPHEEHEPCTSTWYMAGLVIGVAFLPKLAIILGTLVLAVGDPAASVVGKRWGKKKIYADKSWVGSLTLVGVSVAVCLAFMLWRMPELGLFTAIGLALTAAIAGAVAEVFSVRLNDNFTIPVVAGLAVTLLM